MMKPSLAFAFLAPALAACGSSDPTPADAGSVDPPPFTNGASVLSGAAEAGDVDGPRGTARFANPVNVAIGPGGTVYVADFDNHKIRAVDPDDGATTTALAMAGFERPFGMAFAADGTLYVSTDRSPTGEHGPMTGTIWRVDLAGSTATPIAASIGRPRGLAVLPDGRIAAADYEHDVVQLVDPTSGAVTPLAGAWDQQGMVDATGGEARFTTPYGVAYTGGRLVVADYGNHRLREVALDGTVTTLAGAGTAGFADGALATAQFNQPQGVAVDASGALYVTDLGNYRIRRVAGTTVETIAGSGVAGYADNDDPLAAQFYGLEGLAVASDGKRVFVADGGRGEAVPYNRVRVIELP